ncbi:MAG: hypothetical protein WBD36_01195 [Bacteroidota bacterium]
MNQGNVPTTIAHPPAGTRPVSVRIVGIPLLVVAFVSIILNVSNLVLPNELESGLKMLHQISRMPDSTMEESLYGLITLSRILAGVEILYFLVAAIGAVGFLQLREWGRKILEIGCWVGLGFGAGETVLSYTIWREMQLSLAGLLKSLGAGQYTLATPLGMAAILLGLLLWVVPTVGIGVYLRRPNVRALMT